MATPKSRRTNSFINKRRLSVGLGVKEVLNTALSQGKSANDSIPSHY